MSNSLHHTAYIDRNLPVGEDILTTKYAFYLY